MKQSLVDRSMVCRNGVRSRYAMLMSKWRIVETAAYLGQDEELCGGHCSPLPHDPDQTSGFCLEAGIDIIGKMSFKLSSSVLRVSRKLPF